MNKIRSTLLLTVTGIALLGAGSAQAATLIDTFEDVAGGQQSVQRGGTGTVTAQEQPDTGTFPNVIGGYRDLWLQGTSGTGAPLTKVAAGSVANGILSFSNGPGVKSSLNVTWDGNDPGANSLTTNPNSAVPLPTPPATSSNNLRQVRSQGLGTQDLTNGGEFNSFGVELLKADLGIAIDLTVYDTNGTGISTATYEFLAGVAVPTTVFFAFDQAAVDELPMGALFALLTGNARFTNVGAINMRLRALRADVDAEIDLLQLTNTRPPVVATPEPSSSLLALAGVTFLGALTGKKKNSEF